MQPIDDNSGGEIFRRRLAELKTASPTFRIFTAEELDRATDGYSERRIIGPGSNADSIVYKGLLPSSAIVAIKKWVSFSGLHIAKFISELISLSKHPSDKHIVGVVGAGCDQTPLPVVVYEYMPNGSLHRHIHELYGSLCWENRLRIAAVIAEALALLHSAIPNPQFHRGVKSKDILFDEAMAPKMSDFGARLMMAGCFTFLRIREDREGYLGPEFGSFSGRMVEKGDVYGFGVVMAELLTGELAVSVEKGELAKRFREGVAEGRLIEMLEGRVREAEAVEKGKVVEAVAEVATRCLMLSGEERPTMREVAEELQSIVASRVS